MGIGGHGARGEEKVLDCLKNYVVSFLNITGWGPSKQVLACSLHHFYT